LKLWQIFQDILLKEMIKIFLILTSFFIGSYAYGARYGGTLYISTISDPKTFNPIITEETSSSFAWGFLFEGLTRINGVTTEVEPNLAKSWEFSKDGLIWKFFLRDDVYWFDGEKFTADDVIFTFEKLIYNPSIPNSLRDIFVIDDKKLTFRKLSPYIIEIILPKPFAPLLMALATPILPKHILEKPVKEGKFNYFWGVDTPPSKLIGTGPFIMVEYKPGERLVYKRNSRYWRKDNKGRNLPYIERIVAYIVANQEVELLRFEAKQIDILSVRGKDFSYLKSKEKEGNFKLYDCGPSFSSTFLCFNQSLFSPISKEKKRWFNSLKFRRAVAHAIDYKSIIRLCLHNKGYPQAGPMSPAAKFFFNPKVKRYKYNLNLAKKLLSGFKKREEKIKFTILTNVENTVRCQIGALIIEDLKKIGLDVSFTPIDFNTLCKKLDVTHDWDCVIIGLTGGIEPHFGKNVWESSGNLHFWRSKPRAKAKEKLWKKRLPKWERRVDEIFNKGVSILDKFARKKLYDEWQLLVSKNLPLIYLPTPAVIYAIRNKFGNIKPTAYGGALHNIEEIYIK
jgi:peptide/nickel transport system substrate-binding protein